MNLLKIVFKKPEHESIQITTCVPEDWTENDVVDFAMMLPEVQRLIVKYPISEMTVTTSNGTYNLMYVYSSK